MVHHLSASTTATRKAHCRHDLLKGQDQVCRWSPDPSAIARYFILTSRLFVLGRPRPHRRDDGAGRHGCVQLRRGTTHPGPVDRAFPVGQSEAIPPEWHGSPYTRLIGSGPPRDGHVPVRADSGCTRKARVSMIAFGSACSYLVGDSLFRPAHRRISERYRRNLL